MKFLTTAYCTICNRQVANTSNSGNMSERQVKLLICSANLGNAQPDETSWNHWIPQDGSCAQVLQGPQKYPLRRIDDMRFKHQRSNIHEAYDSCDDDVNGDGDGHAVDQFDIIVFGMQESTFDPPKDKDNNVVYSSLPIDSEALDGSMRSTKSAGAHAGASVIKTLSTIHT